MYNSYYKPIKYRVVSTFSIGLGKGLGYISHLSVTGIIRRYENVKNRYVKPLHIIGVLTYFVVNVHGNDKKVISIRINVR